MINGELFAVVSLFLDVDDQTQALIGINHFITNLETFHEG